MAYSDPFKLRPEVPYLAERDENSWWVIVFDGRDMEVTIMENPLPEHLATARELTDGFYFID